MTYAQLISAFSGKAVATGTYCKAFEHGYLVGLNDGNKTFPVCVMPPMQSQWLRPSRSTEKLYDAEIYIFALSDGFTHALRDAEWVLQTNACDKLINDVLAANNTIVLATTPKYERLEDENGALFNQRCVWIECRFQLKVSDCP